MLELPVENNKHINFEWSGAGRGRGGGGNWTVLLFKVTASDDNVSKSLSPIVDFFCRLEHFRPWHCNKEHQKHQ